MLQTLQNQLIANLSEYPPEFVCGILLIPSICIILHMQPSKLFIYLWLGCKNPQLRIQMNRTLPKLCSSYFGPHFHMTEKQTALK